MPLKLIPPTPGRWANYRVRGTHMGCYVDRTTGTPVKTVAQQILAGIRRDIEGGALARPGEPTFASAALSYLDAGGEGRFIGKLNDHFRSTPLRMIDQAAIDAAAKAILPDATAATRNRQVYTPISAILTRAGVMLRIARPKGGNGRARAIYLEPEQAWRLIEATERLDMEIAIYITLCLYTGMRRNEALSITCADVNLTEARAFVDRTKNDDPRTVFLPRSAVAAVANHPQGLDRAGRLFRWRMDRKQSKEDFYGLLHAAYAAAGIDPKGAPVHMLRHTYATWMRRYAKADERDLLDTGAWRDRASVGRYTHTIVNEAARLAEKLPIRAKSKRPRKARAKTSGKTKVEAI